MAADLAKARARPADWVVAIAICHHHGAGIAYCARLPAYAEPWPSPGTPIGPNAQAACLGQPKAHSPERCVSDELRSAA